ncbi:protein-methionine-sulfoxide reductase catalytic subunit MsrP [Terriglobus tenax]|uniref:protein-methionine-sulfoxide reductase catalytic subunit MsrP n=1 Tax=Terriglobus tenax TaxID=1111115 RepID=UPI0021E0E7A5|nr:protein-methionine-sulfoxide reductase catalytic subunit MsrP [Terriglobus tenax]
MLIKTTTAIPSSEITPQDTFLNRRSFLTGAAAVAGAGIIAPQGLWAATKLSTTPGKFSVSETPTPLKKATSYNNFYEFGTDKGDPAANAHKLKPRPWTIAVEGAIQKPLTFDIDTVQNYRPLEDRVYRFRCVEAWSMVIPWVGYSFSEFVKACSPLPSAKYIQFLSLADRKQMDLPDSSGINWPYSEGLRMDEAMHPLTLLTFGSYGQTLEPQQGAPIRIIVPWKYGFKSAKSIVKIRFLDKMPRTSWNDLAPEEYGFYANVNPKHSHPRWSQASERKIDASLFPKQVATLPFNGYANDVASLYNGMNLDKFY